MKLHRSSSSSSSKAGRVALINPDGHAIGLDIGATSVRAAILTVDKHNGLPSATVHGLGSIPLPPGAVVDGAVRDAAAVTTAVKQLWAVNEFNCDHVVLGIANPQVLVREMTLPNLTPQQRAKALPFQARDVIALPIEEVILDFAQLGEVDPETNQISGLLIATPRQPVSVAVAAVERAGLKVARVDLSSFAVLRSTASQNFAVEAVIDMGAHLTTVIIHDHGVPKLVRTVARGGQGLTDLLVEKLSLSSGEAERAKYETGLSGRHAAVATALNDGIRPLLAEIRSSINYFRSANGGARLEAISLTGGASGLTGIAELLTEQNGVPANLVAPLHHVRDSLSSIVPVGAFDIGSATALSVGLAMGVAA